MRRRGPAGLAQVRGNSDLLQTRPPVFGLVCHLKLAAGGATMRMTVVRLPGLPEDGRLEAAKRLFSIRIR
ncbi:uncharacterized [Tachysurus ichikawai]